MNKLLYIFIIDIWFGCFGFVVRFSFYSLCFLLHEPILLFCFKFSWAFILQYNYYIQRNWLKSWEFGQFGSQNEMVKLKNNTTISRCLWISKIWKTLGMPVVQFAINNNKSNSISRDKLLRICAFHVMLEWNKMKSTNQTNKWKYKNKNRWKRNVQKDI